MKRLVAISIIIGVLGACATRPSPTGMVPLVVGATTPLYEVVAPNELKLAPGVTFQTVTITGSFGTRNGIVLLMPNGDTGGYIECECAGSTHGDCTTTSDNPDHPSCSGSCKDSEGKPAGCWMSTLIGPARDPLFIR